MNLKRLFLGMIIALVIFVPTVSAQTAPDKLPIAHVPSVESNTSRATFGIFTTDADDFMDVNGYSSVDFQKVYGVLGTDNDPNHDPLLPSTTGINFGIAKNFGTLYFGFLYSGNFWKGNSTTVKVDGNRNDPSPSPDTGLDIDSGFAFLFGTPTLGGLKVTADLDFGTDTDDDTTDGKIITNTGGMSFGVNWGKNFDVGSGILKPEVAVLYYASLAKVEDKKAKTISGKLPSTIGVTLATDYEFAKKGNFQSVLSTGYTIGFGIYPENEAVAGVKVTVNAGWVTHDIRAIYAQTFDITEKFSAGWSVGGDIIVASFNAKVKTQSSLGSNTAVGAEGFALSIVPQISGAAKYSPAKVITLTSGIQIGGSSLYDVANATAKVASIKSEVTTQTFSPLEATFALGGTLHLGQHFDIDMSFANAFAEIDKGFNFTLNPTNISFNLLGSIKI